MFRFPTILVLSLILSACGAAQKASPSTPKPDPAPKAQPRAPEAPEAPEEPEAPEASEGKSVKYNLASPDWAPLPLTEEHRAMGLVVRLQNTATGARYAVEVVPAPEAMDIEGFAAQELLIASSAGVETSKVVYAPDGLSASFYYEAYGSEVRGKAFLLRKPGELVAVVARAVWPLDVQETSLADIDKMNASLDYATKE